MTVLHSCSERAFISKSTFTSGLIRIQFHFRPQQLGREERSERATSRMARAKEPGGEERMASRSSSSHEAQV
jgi:hypothetical protein